MLNNNVDQQHYSFRFAPAYAVDFKIQKIFHLFKYLPGTKIQLMISQQINQHNY